MGVDELSLSRRNAVRSATLLFGTSLAGCLDRLGSGDDGDPPSGSSPTATSPSTATTKTDDSSDVVTARPDTSTLTSTPTSTPTPDISPSFIALSGTTEAGIDLSNTPVIGQRDAPIDIYYWGDYQCAYCKQFETNYLPMLVRNEIANGTARFVILQYPNYGTHSWTAGVMAKCLWQSVKDRNPDVFWRWHHTVFEHQGLAEKEWSSRKSLLGYARNSRGIDAGVVEQCMRRNRKQFEADIRQERQRGQKEGFSGTPGFMLYARDTGQSVQLRGAQPYSRFHSQIQTLQNQ